MPSQEERVVFQALADMAALVREVDKADKKIEAFQLRASKDVTSKVNIVVDERGVQRLQSDIDRMQRDQNKAIKIPLVLDVDSADTRARLQKSLEQAQRDQRTAIKIPLVLDEGDFKSRVERALAGAGGDVGVNFDIDEAAFERKVQAAIARASGTANVTLDLDEGDFETRVRAALEKAGGSVKVRMDLDEADFRAKVRTAAEGAGGESVKVKIEPDFNIAKLRADMAALDGGRIHLSVDADTAAARLELDRLIHEYSGRSVRINANVNRPGIGGIGGGGGGAPPTEGLGALGGGGGAASGLSGAASGIGGFVAAIAPMTSLIIGAGIALGGLAGAAVALVGALGPAIAALGIAMPFALTSLMGGLGAALLAFKGVGGAIKALSDQQSNQAQTSRDQAKAARDNAYANQQALQAIANAQYALGLAYRQAADQQLSSAESVEGAERGVAEAQYAAQQAQKDLTLARRDALRTLQDMNAQVKQDALDQKGANLSLTEAKQNLDKVMADPHATELQREQAQLTYEDAQQHLSDINTQVKRNADDTAVANKKGVEGSDTVKAALKTQKDSVTQVGLAQQALADALRAQKEGAQDSAHAIQQAQQALASAQQSYLKGIADQQYAAAQATNAVTDAMAKLSPMAQALVRQIIALKPALNDLSKTAQNNMFPQLSEAIKLLTSPQMLALFNTFIGESAKALGDLFLQGAKLMSSPAFRGDLATIFHSSAVGLKNLGGAFLNFIQVITQLMAVAAPFWEAFTKGLSDTVKGWNDVITKARGSGALTDFFKQAFAALHLFNSGMGNLLAIFGHVIMAALPYGMQLLKMFDDWSSRLRTSTKDMKDSVGVQKFFQGSIVIFKGLIAVVGGLLKLIVHMVQAFSTLGDWNTKHGGALTTLFHDLGAAIAGVVMWLVDHLIIGMEALALWYQQNRAQIVAFWQQLTDFFKEHPKLLLAIAAALGGAFAISKVAPFLTALTRISELLRFLPALLGGISFGGLAIGAGVLVSLAAAVKGFADLYKVSSDFRDQVHQLGEDVATVWGKVWDTLGPVFKKVWKDLVDFFKANWPTFISIIDNLVKIFGILWDKLGPIIKKVEPIFKDMLHVIGDVFKIINGLLEIFVGLFTGNWQLLWKGIKDLFSGIWHFIVDNFKESLDKLLLIWSVFANILKGAWDLLWNAVKAVAGLIWKSIELQWSALMWAFRTIWNTVGAPVFNAIKDTMNWLWHTILQPIWKQMGDGWAGLGAAFNWVKVNVFDKVWQGIKDGINGVKTVFDTVVAGIKTIWNTLKGIIAAPYNDVVLPVLHFLASAVDKVVGWVSSGSAPLQSLEKLGPVKFSTGGEVPGAGTGIHDTVNARLAPGEIVIKKQVAQRHREELLGLNARGYAVGGEVAAGSALSGVETMSMINSGQLFSPVSAKQASANTPGNGTGGAMDWLTGKAEVEALTDAGSWVIDKAKGWLREGAALAFDESYKLFVKPFLGLAPGHVGDVMKGSINKIEKEAYNWIKGKEHADGDASGFAGDWTGGSLTWPVPGFYTISQHFGSHPGIDIPAPTHSMTVAANTGTVLEAGSDDPLGYGTVLKILGQGLGTLYGHERPEDFKVKAGDHVTAGQPVGGVGSLGNSTGPHLHFEVHKGGFGANSLTDPEPYLHGNAPSGSVSTAAGVEKYRGLTNQILILLGQNASLANRVLSQMQLESGGNPNVVNKWDSNWVKGTPSAGLMQVIGPTYQTYRHHPDTGPYAYGVSLDPFSNIYAGVNYATTRYPPPYYGLGLGHGYAIGGQVRGSDGANAQGFPPRIGGSMEDTVPAWLTPGEFVVRKKVVDQLGLPYLQQLNNAPGLNGGGFANGYATGGPVKMYAKEPNIAFGATGQAVKDLQYALDILANAKLPIDGKFGMATRTNVQSLQRFFQLPVSGVATRQTWDLLDYLAWNKTHPSPPLAGATAGVFSKEPARVDSSTYGQPIKDLQTALNAVGNYGLPVTGTYDLKDYGVIKALQGFYKMPANGVVDTKFWALLNSLEKLKKVGAYKSATAPKPGTIPSATVDIDAVIKAQAATNTQNTQFAGYIATLAGKGYNYLVQFLTGEDIATAFPVAREAATYDSKAQQLNAQLKQSASILTGADLGSASLIAASLQRHPGEGLREAAYDVLLTDQTTVNLADLVRWYNRGSLQPILAGLPAANSAKLVSDIKAWNAGVPFAAGGSVLGEGNGDTVPAWLTPGEYVVRKKVVQRMGTAFFENLNNQQAPGLFSGGPAKGMLAGMGLHSFATPKAYAFSSGGPVGDSIYSSGGDRMLARELHVHNPTREETEESLTKVARSVVRKGVF